MRALLSHPLHHSQLKQSLKEFLQHRKRARAQADGRQSGARDGVPPVRASQCRCCCCCCHHHDVQSGAPQEAVESCQAVTLVATWVFLFLFLLLKKQKKV